jgi:acetyl-CoA carboxylase carboxyltransferase component
MIVDNLNVAWPTAEISVMGPEGVPTSSSARRSRPRLE